MAGLSALTALSGDDSMPQSLLGLWQSYDVSGSVQTEALLYRITGRTGVPVLFASESLTVEDVLLSTQVPVDAVGGASPPDLFLAYTGKLSFPKED